MTLAGLVALASWAVAAPGGPDEASATPAAPRTQARVVGDALGVGEQGTVEILLTTDGRPAVGHLSLRSGTPVDEVGPGRFRTTATQTHTDLTLHGTWRSSAGTMALDIPVASAVQVPQLSWRDGMLGVAGGREPLDLALQWSGEGDLEDVWLSAAAGSVTAIRQEADGVHVGLLPPTDAFPRAIPVLAVDLGATGAPPSLGVVVLRARTRIPVRTEPGTEVSVQIGGRSLPPVVADASGVATVAAWVLPGDETARIRLADAAGNVNTSTIRLGGDPRPHLVGLATPGQPGERAASVLVAATTAAGRPWSQAPPRCATPAGTDVPLWSVAAGVWRGPLDPTAAELGRVECHLGSDAQVAIRVPRAVPRASSLELRVSPPEVDARAPDATVRAWVIDDQGDRLPVVPPEVHADHGTLQPVAETSPGVATYRYDGTPALSRGGDTIRAEWSAPAGGGPIRDLELQWELRSGQVVAYGRALDASGHPLLDTPLTFAFGAARADQRAGDHGWARVALDLPAEPQWLTVRGAQSGRSTGTWVVAGTEPPRAAVAADLRAEASLRIVTGPVRRVGLQVEPPILRTLDGQTGRVVLELFDGQGSPVTDQPVELSASRGEVTDLRRRSDGAYEATFRPDRPGDVGSVDIVARSPDGSFPTTTTQLELVAEDIRRAPGLHVGWLAGGDGVSSPWVSIDGDVPLEVLPDQVLLRASLGLYGLRAEASDPATGEELAVSADLVPLSLGLIGRQPRGRLVTWAGASVVLVPYWVTVSVGESRGVRGLALAPPGAHAHAGAGVRTRHGQIDLDLGYLFVTTNAGDGGWQGGAGGFLTTVGYRHAF